MIRRLSVLYVTRFELATFWSVARRSIQLSYTYIPPFRKRIFSYSNDYFTEITHLCQAVFAAVCFTALFVTEVQTLAGPQNCPGCGVSHVRPQQMPAPRAFMAGTFKNHDFL